MIVNRTEVPSIKQINSFNIVKAAGQVFPNGVPFYSINSNDGDFIKIEWMFVAGNWVQPSPLVAFAVNSMLSEGSQKYSSVQISEMIDFYGAFLSFNVDKDFAFVSLMCMGKYLAEVLEIVEEVIKNATFPEHELEVFRNKHKQQFLVEQTKVRNIARSEHAGLLFGTDHPYGYKVVDSDFDKLNRDSLVQFHRERYQSANCKIIASGKVDENVVKTIEQYFGVSFWNAQQTLSYPVCQPQTSPGKKVLIEKDDAVQSAVRIGKVLFNKHHSDYHGMQILNCILGGYFGSRLMAKIREEKGYTYGINSLFVTLKNEGYLAIVSELGTEVTVPAIEDIYAEIEKLRQEPVAEDELERVKNYILGDIVRMFDGPFAQAESFISLIENDLDYDHFDQMISTVKNITAGELQLLAQKYFDPASFTQVVVGKMK
ncbi:MAG: pitrilysin family protein [Bacteroidota bacterium]|nr:pitrilysin family protein [Bacteroidota bacterium]